MSNVWFTSDLHIGHDFCAKARGFTSTEEHDATVIANINKVVHPKDKLFILGDCVWTSTKIHLLDELNGIKELIIGNHDTFTTQEYLKRFTKVHGFRAYKEFWLSHCPIHPQEIYRCRGNIHGHLHNGAATSPLPYPYFNVNMDYNNMCPVNFDTIDTFFREEEKRIKIAKILAAETFTG